jgi:hypothetical protein
MDGVQFATPRHVLSKGSAALLILLTLLPVTAPFSTCDVATFFGRAPVRQSMPYRLPQSEDKSSASAPATVPPAVSSAGVRIRLLMFMGFRVLPTSRLEAAAVGEPALDSFITAHSIPVTNLRV